MHAFVRGWSVVAVLCAAAASAQEAADVAVDAAEALPAVSAEEMPAVGPAVTVEVAILEFAADDSLPPASDAEAVARYLTLEREGRALSRTRMRLTTLDQQKASVQHAEQLAVPTGQVSFGGRNAQTSTSYDRIDVGTTVALTPRIEPDGNIIMELIVERSRLRPTPAASESPATPVPPAVESLDAKTTLRIPNGSTVVAHSNESTSAGRPVTQVMLVTARTATDAGR